MKIESNETGFERRVTVGEAFIPENEEDRLVLSEMARAINAPYNGGRLYIRIRKIDPDSRIERETREFRIIKQTGLRNRAVALWLKS